MSSAYLLILRGVVYDIVHEYWEQFGNSVHTCSESAIWSIRSRSLTGLFGGLYPLSRYRVYDIEHAQLVSARCLFEMGEDLLDENGFILG